MVPSWTQDAIESNNQARNPRIQTATTTLDANIQSSKTITYNTNFNVTQEQTRDWGSGAPGDLVFQRDVTYTLIASPSFERPQVETISAKNPEDPQQTFMPQGKTEFFYDQYPLAPRTGAPNHNGNTSEVGRGDPTQVKHSKSGSVAVTETMKYDILGNVVQKIDPLNHSTLLSYTDNFSDTINRNTFAYPTQTTNPAGHNEYVTYNFDTGLVTRPYRVERFRDPYVHLRRASRQFSA